MKKLSKFLMRKVSILTILLFLMFSAICSSCKTVATKAEIKAIQKHSQLCHEDIHAQWRYYSKKRQEAITSRFLSANKLFQAILKEKKNHVTQKSNKGNTKE